MCAILECLLRTGRRLAWMPWRMRWLGLPVASLLFAASAAASNCPPLPVATDAAPADRGLLWELHKDGRRSWLYASLHVGRPDWMRPGPRLTAALDQSDVVALEIDPADVSLQQPSGASAAPALGEALSRRLALAAQAACLPAGALDGLPPVLQATVLAMLDARWLGLDASHAQEQLLAGQARMRRLPVVALESVAQQVRALTDGTPEQTAAMVAQTLDQIDDQRGRRVMATLVTAWASGDLDTLANFALWCDCAASDDDRAFLRRMNDERNPALAAGIAALHDSGKRVFAAVGALHMTGPAALPGLLAERGFRVWRVPLAGQGRLSR